MIKHDQNKPPIAQGVLCMFPRAIRAVANISAHGAEKYSWYNWLTVPDGVERYRDAQVRHVMDEAVDGPNDPDSGHLHAAAAAWNALARLELILRAEERP
jgi:hypothetical protein